MLGHQATNDGVASLVIRSQGLLVLAHGHRAALGTHQDLVACTVEVVHADFLLVATCGKQRSLIGQIGQIGTGEARGTTCNHQRHDVVGQRQLAHVHAQDLLAALDVRQADHDLTVEATRTQQRRIQHVRTVGRSNHDHAFAALKAIHLDQQLVEGLLALVMTAAQTGTAMTAHRIDFVDEDDARGMLLGLLEHVAHAAGADAHEHFDEVRTGDAEERHLGFAGDRLGKQRLARTRRAHHQNAARNLATQLGELGGIAQEVDQLAHFFLGFIAACDVSEGDLDLVFALQLGARLAEAHRPLGAAATALHLAHDEQPEADDQDDRQEVEHQRPEARPGGRLLAGHFDVLAVQHVDQLVVARTVDGGFAAVGALEADRVDGQVGLIGVIHRLHPARIHFLQELGVGDRVRAHSAGHARRKALEDDHQHNRDDHP